MSAGSIGPAYERGQPVRGHRLLLFVAAASASAPKNIVAILIDDLGSYDTAVNNRDIVHFCGAPRPIHKTYPGKTS